MATRVRLTAPGNAILDGLPGVLLSDKPGPGYILDHGDRYRVLVGGYWTFEIRVLREEFVRDEPTELLREISGRAVRFTGETGNGEMCSNCLSLRMRRNGSCLLCEDCGTTTGCS